jgi:hypothetical protein
MENSRRTTMTRRLSFDHTPKMLASRRSGTTDIALFWSKRKHRAAVAVDDEATGEHFELEVNSDDDALDLYNHPYAYAASRHVTADARAA